MLIETIVALFMQQHYPEATYEIRREKNENYLRAWVETKDDYFYCGFNLLDAETKKFTASCNTEPERSFAYALINDSELVDIKRKIFSPEEVLGQLEGFFSNAKELDEFMADASKIDLLFEKLFFYGGKYGNEWTVGLNPMYADLRFDDLFLSMDNIGMVWDANASRFRVPVPNEFVSESTYDATNGIITVNRKLLLFTLNPNAYIELSPVIPAENADQLLIYEGEIKTDLGDDALSEGAYIKITVSAMDQLPAANMRVEWNDRTFEGKTPALIINNKESGLHFFTLTEHRLKKSFDEIEAIVRKNMPADALQYYLEHLEKVREDY